jgi:hypothetical protein
MQRLNAASRRTLIAISVGILVVSGGVMSGPLWELWDQQHLPGPVTKSVVRAAEPAGPAPRAVPAAEVRLRDDAEVIGVVAGGRSRAYVVETLAPVSRHVVNDLVGGVPVTVTYCDQTDCVRVFTAPGRGRPLDMVVAGWVARVDHGTMALLIGTTLYCQDTCRPVAAIPGEIPYPQADFVRITWRRWRDQHPDTDVYFGELPFGLADVLAR